MDNQQLAEILCGHTKLQIEELRPICSGITDRIAKWLEDGRKPATDQGDPVLWVPRELNKRADRVCNIVMDQGSGHSYVHRRIKDILKGRFNFKISSDGGIRGGRVSAIGWSVWAVRVDGEGREMSNRVILEGGTYFRKGMSSLEAEARALADALMSLARFL